MSKLTSAILVVAGLGFMMGPATAWDHGMMDARGVGLHFVQTYDTSNTVYLAFLCRTDRPGVAQIELRTGEPPLASGTQIELSLKVEERMIGPIAAVTQSAFGHLEAVTPVAQSAIYEAAQAVHRSSGSFQVFYSDKAWTFPSAYRQDGFGAMLDACD